MGKSNKNTLFRNNVAKFIRKCRRKGQTKLNIAYSIQGFCAGWLAYGDEVDRIFEFESKLSQVSHKDIE